MEKLYKNAIWFVVSFSMIAYFFYRILSMEIDLQTTLTDPETYVHLIFTIYLNIIVANGAEESGVAKALESEEYGAADILNNKIIKGINQNLNGFRDFIIGLNEFEKETLQENFLFNHGVKSYDNLTRKEKKAFNKLKPIQHDIYGINLPLYYEATKGNKISYRATYDTAKSKRKAYIVKIVNGLIFGGITIGLTFAINNTLDAFISLIIIGSGLVVTYFIRASKPIFNLRYRLPKVVLNKANLYETYKQQKATLTSTENNDII